MTDMYDIANLITDSATEVEGVWVPMGSGEIKVAREGNEEYQDYLMGLVNANRALLDQNDKAARKVQRDLMIRAYAKTILKDVRNIQFKGKPIEKYTVDLGIELLTIKDFFNKVQAYAQQFEAYQKKAEEEAVKN